MAKWQAQQLLTCNRCFCSPFVEAGRGGGGGRGGWIVGLWTPFAMHIEHLPVKQPPSAFVPELTRSDAHKYKSDAHK